MTNEEARAIAGAVRLNLPPDSYRRLKAVHVVTRPQDGMLTIRCYFKSQSPDDPEPFIFNVEEL